MTWVQDYAPVLHSIGLSALIAVIPILFLFWALAVKRMKGHIAALYTVILAILDAVLVFRMPVGPAISATLFGMATGFWPIGWIILTVVFLYKITVKTGHFDVIRESIAGLTDDRRLQALLIAFSFGAFLEGAAGFGAPVAIAGAMLVGLGFNPLYAAGLSLIADTAPVAFGAIGIPITAVAKVVHMNPLVLSQVVGRQLPFMSLIVPFWLVAVMSGWKGVKEVWPAILVAGGSFSITQFLVSNFIGPELPDVLSALVSLVSLVLFLRVWKPAKTFHFENEPPVAVRAEVAKHSGGKVFVAWLPYLVLTLMIILWTIKPIQELLAVGTQVIHWPGLDKVVLKVAPIAKKPTPIEAAFSLNLLAATGTSILIAAVFTGMICRQSIGAWFATLGETLKELWRPLVMISLVVGFGQLANFSPMSAAMALALAATGALFPFFSPILGWIGVFLTGSDTSSNLLFGGLQKLTAQQLHINPALTVGANSSGGVMGKMISPQSIAVGTSATGLVGREGDLYRFTLKHSVGMLLIISVITTLQAYVLSGMIPH